MQPRMRFAGSESSPLRFADAMLPGHETRLEDRRALRQALDDAASGRAMVSTQSTRLLGPVVRAMGSVQEVMERGGPQAVSDLWRAGFPMALAGRIATWFKSLPAEQRGIAAVLTLAAGMLVTVGLIAGFVFD